MEWLNVDEVSAMSVADRQRLCCVKVAGASRASLEQVAHRLGAKMCGHATCTTMLFPGWARTRCSACRPPKAAAQRAGAPSAAEQVRDSRKSIKDARAAINQERIDVLDELVQEGHTVITPTGEPHFPDTMFGRLRRWCHYQLVSFGLRKPPPTSLVPMGSASFPPEVVPTQTNSTDGGQTSAGGVGAGDVYPTPLPVLAPVSVFQDDKGNLLDVSAVNCHTAVLGKSGDGKTHLTCHLIMQWAPVKGWNHGWVAAIMPRATWENNPLYRKLLGPAQVYFVDECPSKADKAGLMEWIKLTVAENRRNNVASLVLIDDCVPYLLNGQLPIVYLLTNGRSMWLTVISLWQSPVRSGLVGNVVRANKANVIFFNSMIGTVAKVEEWVPEDQVKEFKQVTRSELGKHWAGVINTGNNSLSKVQAPVLVPVTTLGRPELMGKLITEPPKASDREPRRERAFDEDEGDELPNRRRTTAVTTDKCADPPGCDAGEWDPDDGVMRCTVCGHEIPESDDNMSIDDGDSGGDDDSNDGDEQVPALFPRRKPRKKT